MSRVEVAGKTGLPDAAGSELLGQLPFFGLSGAAEVRVGRLYEFTGRYSPSQVDQIARELLCDPITQEYRTGESVGPAFLVGPHWRVEVWYHAGVSDPLEAGVRKGVADLGLPAPERVRCGTVYKIVGRCPSAQVERVAAKLLCNPLIHRYSVTAP